jgi:hypothetical protein
MGSLNAGRAMTMFAAEKTGDLNMQQNETENHGEPGHC